MSTQSNNVGRAIAGTADAGKADASNHCTPSTSRNEPVDQDRGDMDAPTPTGSDFHIILWQVKNDREFLISNIDCVMDYYKGSGNIFLMKKSIQHVKPGKLALNRATMYLRVQYIRVFVNNFVSPIRCKIYRKLSLFEVFTNKIMNLRLMIVNGETLLSNRSIKTLVIYTRLITDALIYEQTSWKKLPDGSTVTSVELAIECLAQEFHVSKEEITEELGIPLPRQIRADQSSISEWIDNIY